MSNKRYFFNCIEEGIMNPEYEQWRQMRVEVIDQSEEGKKHYGGVVYEACLRLPVEIFDAVYEAIDFKEADVMPYMRWDVEDN